MKTSKELIERLESDEAFKKEIEEAVKAKQGAGEETIDAMISAAADFDYAITKEELEVAKAANSEEMSEEELGKLSGGSVCWYWLVACTVINTIKNNE